MRIRFIIAAIAVAGFACRGYVPARFAARPPVENARDQGPVEAPRSQSVPEPVYLSEVFLHGPLREALDLSPQADAEDINSMDQVPQSTWFMPRVLDVGTMARGPEGTSMPQPPFTVLPAVPVALSSPGFCIRDSRGLFYEIAVDPVDRPEMRTGALMVASRLFWALGFNTPPVTLMQARANDFWGSEGARPDALTLLAASAPAKGGYYRVAAIAWPAGQDLGRAPETGTRGDDPNDLIAHENRRTLRALKVLASWLALAEVGPAKAVDRYVGAPGEGHVIHYMVGLDDALGARRVVRVTDPKPDAGGGSPFIRFLTLGLAANSPRLVTQVEVPAIGALDRDVDPENADVPLPYAPVGRLQPADGYWAARRMTALSSTHLALAIEAAKFTDGRAQKMLQGLLEARRIKVVTHWLSTVVPLELVSFDGATVRLRDEAVGLGIEPVGSTDYLVKFLAGGEIAAAEPALLHPAEELLDVTLPDGAVAAARDYLVLEITARRARRSLPRVFELHIRGVEGRPTVVGIRH